MKRQPPTKESLNGMPMHVRAEMALKEAVADAIAEHKQMGRSTVVWREGNQDFS
jgi:hypothetical protein